jgi:hypothetical protein
MQLPIHRRTIWLSVCAVGLLLGHALLERASDPRFAPFRIKLDDVKRLERGMYEAEVAAIIGRPAGDYRRFRKDEVAIIYDGSVFWAKAPAYEKRWLTDEATVEVGFDEEQRVNWVAGHVDDPVPTWWDKMKEHLSRWIK